MNWHHLALAGAGAAGAILALFGVALVGAYLLADDEAKLSPESAEWMRR